jgi:NAD-dependent deacetylase
MPEQATNQAVMLCSSCDFLLVIGSTLLVQPACLLPGYARQNGAFLAMINLSETPYDAECDIKIEEKAGQVMEAILQEMD